MKKVYYRIITPSSFSNIDLPTLEEAKQSLHDFGTSSTKEYKKYWEQQRDLCKIVKVTQVTEEITII